MSKILRASVVSKTHPMKPRFAFTHLKADLTTILGALLLCATIGCQTVKEPSGEASSPDNPKFTEAKPPEAAKAAKADTIVLREGDTVRVSFPASPDMNKAQQIRRDGMITLPLIGEFKAVGLTPLEMQKELLKLYEPQLQTKEVIVSVDSAALSIYVTGAVLRQGRITSDRPMTVLEAVLDAGIDYTKANLKKVSVIRQEDGRTEHHTINLRRVLDGQQDVPFSLKPLDVIYVPERFAWF